jgi:Holliday junction resolvase
VGYRSGRRFEYEVRDYFERRGWLVVRAARSKPVDLVCIRGGKAVLVECKYGKGRLTRSDRKALERVSKRYGVEVLVAVKKRRGRLELEKISHTVS